MMSVLLTEFEKWHQEATRAFRSHAGKPPWSCYRCRDKVTSLKPGAGVLHHIDGDQQNNSPRNLGVLHPWCHDAVHDEQHQLRIRAWKAEEEKRLLPRPIDTIPFRGARSGCTSCGEVFSGESAFDRHRIFVCGHDYRHREQCWDGRRCLRPPEMRKAGMVLDDAGVWRNPGASGRVRAAPRRAA